MDELIRYYRETLGMSEDDAKEYADKEVARQQRVRIADSAKKAGVREAAKEKASADAVRAARRPEQATEEDESTEDYNQRTMRAMRDDRRLSIGDVRVSDVKPKHEAGSPYVQAGMRDAHISAAGATGMAPYDNRTSPDWATIGQHANAALRQYEDALRNVHETHRRLTPHLQIGPVSVRNTTDLPPVAAAGLMDPVAQYATSAHAAMLGEKIAQHMAGATAAQSAPQSQPSPNVMGNAAGIPDLSALTNQNGGR